MTSKKRPLQRALLLLTLVSIGCKPTEFQTIEKSSPLTNVGFPVSCELEKSKSVKISDRNTNIINLTKSCVSDGKSDKKPADIVFVIDITASMEDSLNTVKNGVERFALQLRKDKGWDARFAAVGFRDSVTQVIPFSDEKTISFATRTWVADGGEDPQEAGQAGLAAAVSLITSDATSNPSRSSANKIILYIGDAIGYALNGNHKDFSTTALEEVFSAVPVSIKPQMRFYHSSARQVEGCVMPAIFGCLKKGFSTELAAFPQMSALAQKINLPGRSFDFPFTESIMLSEFMDEFVPGQACVLRSAIVKDSSGKELTKTNESGVLNLPRGTRPQNLQVDVERCCHVERPAGRTGASCTPVKNSLSVRFD